VYFNAGTGYTAFDVARSGSLIYVPGAQRLEESELLWLDRQGQVISTVARKMFNRMSAIALAGHRVAAAISTNLEDSELWVHDTRRGDWTQLTSGLKAGDPVWSPDGKWLAFDSSRSGNQKLFRVLADGSGAPEQLTTGVEWEWPGGFSPNGSVLVFMRNSRAAQWDLMTLSLDRPGADPQTFHATPNPEMHPAFSPDGHWIAYDSNETGSRQIHVRPYKRPGDRVTVSTGGGWTPTWRADGRELFYRRDREVWSVPVETGLAFRAGTPQRLFRAEFLSNHTDSRLAVSEDGRRFLVVGEPPRERTEPLLVYSPSWVEEANRTARR
jgi:dipeptidyl aminopeptidase/acylaminoacyl peptidase